MASAVGGIVDQILDGETGLLDELSDLMGFAARESDLLEDPAVAARLGGNARRRVTEQFLADRHLLQYAERGRAATLARLLRRDAHPAWYRYSPSEEGKGRAKERECGGPACS